MKIEEHNIDIDQNVNSSYQTEKLEQVYDRNTWKSNVFSIKDIQCDSSLNQSCQRPFGPFKRSKKDLLKRIFKRS